MTPNQELQLEQTQVVREPVCIDFMGPEVQPVLSTPALIMWLEMASRQAAGPLLQEDEETVGTAMDLKHLAPTPLGMKVTLKTRIVEVEGRRIRFQLEAFDEVEKIAEGWHERARVSVPPLRRLPGTQTPPRIVRRTCLKQKKKELSTKGQCAVKRRLLLAGANPAQQLSLRLVAARADHGGNDMV